MGKGFLSAEPFGADTPATNLSFYHNLVVHHVDRNIFVNGGKVDMVNNAIYNWRGSAWGPGIPTHVRTETGSSYVNIVGNYYLPGPGSMDVPPVGMSAAGLPGSVYLRGNLDTKYRPNNTYPEDAVIKKDFGGGIPFLSNRHDYPLVTTTSAAEPLVQVLVGAGAMLPRRDAVDARILNDARNKTGKIIGNPSEVGGWPPFATVSHPPSYDTDRDEMPDSWELAYGLNPNDVTDGPRVATNGYANLENYLNELPGDPVFGADSPSAPQKLRIR